MKTRTAITAAAVLAGLGALSTTAQAHPYGWRIGQDSSGELTVDFLWDVTHKRWDARSGFEGVVDDNLNFEEWPVPNPAIDLNPIDPGAKIVIEVVSFDAGVKLWDPTDLGAGPISSAGEQYSIGTGGTSFIRGALWQVDQTAPGFDAGKGVWEASFIFKDLSGAHADSQTYTYLLEPAQVPAPAGALALGAVGALAARRRR